MISCGRRSKAAFKKASKDKKMIPLDSKMVEAGEVYKEPVFKNSEVEISFLWVGPNSSIVEHTHTDDSETYRDIDNDVTEICCKGESHSCYNFSPKNWLLVLAIKKRN